MTRTHNNNSIHAFQQTDFQLERWMQNREWYTPHLVLNDWNDRLPLEDCSDTPWPTLQQKPIHTGTDTMEVWKYTLSTWASLGREERTTICFFPLVVKCNDYCYNVIIWEMSTARIRYLPSISLFPRMQECSGRVFKHPSSFKYTLYSFESRREIGDWGEFSEGDWLYLHWKRAK